MALARSSVGTLRSAAGPAGKMAAEAAEPLVVAAAAVVAAASVGRPVRLDALAVVAARAAGAAAAVGPVHAPPAFAPLLPSGARSPVAVAEFQAWETAQSMAHHSRPSAVWPSGRMPAASRPRQPMGLVSFAWPAWRSRSMWPLEPDRCEALF